MTRGWSLYLWDNPWQLWGDINFREDSDALKDEKKNPQNSVHVNKLKPF